MTERTVDPTRQGGHEPEASDANVVHAVPTTLAEALAAVETWRATPGMPLTGLHRIAQVLAVARAGADAYAKELLGLLDAAREESGSLRREIEALRGLLGDARLQQVEIERLTVANAGLRAYRDSLRQMLGQAIEEREKLKRRVREVAAAAVTCGDRLDWLACLRHPWFPCCVARDRARAAMGMEPVRPENPVVEVPRGTPDA